MASIAKHPARISIVDTFEALFPIARQAIIEEHGIDQDKCGREIELVTIMLSELSLLEALARSKAQLSPIGIAAAAVWANEIDDVAQKFILKIEGCNNVTLGVVDKIRKKLSLDSLQWGDFRQIADLLGIHQREKVRHLMSSLTEWLEEQSIKLEVDVINFSRQLLLPTRFAAAQKRPVSSTHKEKTESRHSAKPSRTPVKVPKGHLRKSTTPATGS